MRLPEGIRRLFRLGVVRSQVSQDLTMSSVSTSKRRSVTSWTADLPSQMLERRPARASAMSVPIGARSNG